MSALLLLFSIGCPVALTCLKNLVHRMRQALTSYARGVFSGKEKKEEVYIQRVLMARMGVRMCVRTFGSSGEGSREKGVEIWFPLSGLLDQVYLHVDVFASRVLSDSGPHLYV